MTGQLFGHWLLIQSPISHLQSLGNRTESWDLLTGGSPDLGPSPEATEEYTEKALSLAQVLMCLKETYRDWQNHSLFNSTA